MHIRCVASVGTPKGERRKWAEWNNHGFKDIEKYDAYAKEIFFYPTKEEAQNTHLLVLGYEKSAKDKVIPDRVWTSTWALHICVGGKGYYNSIPLSKGSCFVSWPYEKHSVFVDPNDPLEFYWIILGGQDLIDFVESFGFSETKAVFEISKIDDLVNLFEIGLNANYENFDIYKYTTGFITMLMSFYKPQFGNYEKNQYKQQEKNYSVIAKQMLRHSRYILSVDQMAKDMGISPNYLSKLFYKDNGESLKQYIMRKKFEFAASLIKKGFAPTEVAELLKYSSYSAFHRAFVAKFGVTPAQYAKQNDTS